MSPRPRIRACPFDFTPCEEDCLGVIVEKLTTDYGVKYRAYVRCEDCGSSGPWEFSYDEDEARVSAIASWNQRRNCE